MKVFSDFEKKVISKIIDIDKKGQSMHVSSFLDKVICIKSQATFVGHEYDYILNENETFYYKIEIKGYKTEISSDYVELSKKFNELYYLLKYLIENGLLLQLEGSNFRGLAINLRDFPNPVEIEVQEMYLTDTLKYLLKLCSFHFQPTEELKDLAKNKFISKDERNLRKTRLISIISIVISIFSLLFNSVFKFIDSNSKDNIEMRIDTNSINYYIKKQNMQFQKTKTLNDSIKLNKNNNR